MLARLASKRLEALEGRSRWKGLADFIPSVSPHYETPAHLRPLLETFDRIAAGEKVEAVFHAPPQHGKTDTTLHGIAYVLSRWPSWPIQYISYNQTIAETKSAGARRLATEVGIEFQEDRRTLGYWQTREGGGLLATGIGQSAGFPARLVIVDDPYRNRQDAESAAYRKHALEWFQDVALARRHKDASTLIFSTRWNPKDLSGTFIDQGWPYYRLPAIQDREAVDYDPRPIGEPLWPALKPQRFLDEIQGQVGEYTWASVWQGTPRSRGGSLFGPATYYDELPRLGFRAAIGFDLAYTARTHADYSVAVVLLRIGERFFVADVVRVQVEAPSFGPVLRRLQEQWRAPAYIYAAGPEKGSVDFIRRDFRVNANVLPMTGDKFVRAQAAAAAWNAGRVLVPRSAPWLDAFLDELGDFTGVDDDHDDQVDALAPAYNVLHVLTGAGAATKKWRGA